MKLFIAVPAYGETFYAPCVSSLVALAVELERRKWRSNLATLSYAEVATARNMLLTHWFDKTDASHLLFVDADMGFPPQLIFDMLEFDRPLTGVVYPKRKIDLDRFAKAVLAGQPTDKAAASAHDFVVEKPMRRTAKKGFVRVESCGTGILLVRRDCVDLMTREMPEMIDDRALESVDLYKRNGRLIRAFEFLTVDGRRLSEDFSFCYRWRKCGGEIWANVSHPITHIGLRHFTARYDDAPGGTRNPLSIKVVTKGQQA